MGFRFFLLQDKHVYLRNVLSKQADHLKKLLQPNLFLRFKIQDSRLRTNFFNTTSLDSRFKIQGPEKTSSTQPLWIQDSRFKAQKKFFNPTSLDSRFKIQDSRLRKNFFNPTSLDSRFKIQGTQKIHKTQAIG
jgi:hypothetical protein